MTHGFRRRNTVFTAKISEAMIVRSIWSFSQTTYGQVLVAGGYNSTVTELFDPATGT